MLYTIFEGNIEKFEKKVFFMIKKCEKYNNTFHYERKKTVYHTEKEPLTGIERTYKYYIVELNGIIKCDNWQVIAMLESTPNGNIVKTSSENTIKIPQHYIDNSLVCEHCNTNRTRKYTFILYNENTNEYKSVGKSCLSDFVGKDLEHVAQWYEWQDRITKFAAPITERRYQYFDNLTILTYANAIIDIFGYHKTIEDEPTAYKTLCYLHPAKSDKKEMKKYNFQITKNNENKAREIIKYFVEAETTNEYMHNLQVLCKNGYVTRKEVGILVSAVVSYDKHLEFIARQKKMEERNKQLAKSNYIGNVGEKVTINIANWHCVYSYDTQWGTTHIYQFTTSNNDVVIWKTSTYINQNKTPQNIVISGKIKEHKNYNGTKQTILTRCKITF